METPKALDTARAEMTLISKSVVIKGGLSCSEDLYIDGQVEGTINPKGKRLSIGPNGGVKANAGAVVVEGRLEGNIQSERPGRPKTVSRCHGRNRDPAYLY
jgi:cytoskeletal protein CcmA (bactofilin family)